MRELPIKLGPLAILLTVICICMTALAILTFTTARADMNLASTYAGTVKTRYALEAEGQEFLAEALKEGAVPAGTGLKDGIYTKTFEKDGAYLRIAFTFDSGRYEIREWIHGKHWEPDESAGNLWDGD